MNLRVDATADRTASGFAAAFELRGDGTRGDLRLASPLGAQLAAARWSPSQAVLETPGRRDTFASLDALAEQALGEALPLAALPDWLDGRPWPGAPSRSLADGFEQLGWQIDLKRVAERWIEARRAEPPAVTLRVRLDDAAP